MCGIIQDGVGYRKNEPVIRLHMEAYLGAPETYDSVEIEGSPNLSMKIAGGIHGDVATASIVVNSIPKVLQAPPGLHTMRDLAAAVVLPRPLSSPARARLSSGLGSTGPALPTKPRRPSKRSSR